MQPSPRAMFQLTDPNWLSTPDTGGMCMDQWTCCSHDYMARWRTIVLLQWKPEIIITELPMKFTGVTSEYKATDPARLFIRVNTPFIHVNCIILFECTQIYCLPSSSCAKIAHKVAIGDRVFQTSPFRGQFAAPAKHSVVISYQRVQFFFRLWKKWWSPV